MAKYLQAKFYLRGFALLIILCKFTVLSRGEETLNFPFFETYRLKLENAYSVCQKELKLPSKDLSGLSHDIAKGTIDKGLAFCIQSCVSQKLNLIKDNAINKSEMLSVLKSSFKKENSVQAEITKAVNKCSEVTATQSSCSLMAKFIDCFLSEIQSNNLVMGFYQSLIGKAT